MILIVEDDPLFGQLLVDMLVDFVGFTDVKWARSISEASGIFKEGVVETVFLDTDLPDGKGYDFAKKIRGKGSKARIISISGHRPPDSENDKEGFSMPFSFKEFFSGFLTKPFSLNDLQREIDKA